MGIKYNKKTGTNTTPTKHMINTIKTATSSFLRNSTHQNIIDKIPCKYMLNKFNIPDNKKKTSKKKNIPMSTKTILLDRTLCDRDETDFTQGSSCNSIRKDGFNCDILKKNQCKNTKSRNKISFMSLNPSITSTTYITTTITTTGIMNINIRTPKNDNHNCSEKKEKIKNKNNTKNININNNITSFATNGNNTENNSYTIISENKHPNLKF